MHTKIPNILPGLQVKTMLDGTHPLLRQLMGAVGGALIALVIYKGYTFVAPRVEVIFAPAQSVQEQAILDETREARMDRIGALAAEKFNALRASAPDLFLPGK